MIAALLKFHHDVEKARSAALGAFTEGLVVPRQDPPGRTHTSKTRLEVRIRKIGFFHLVDKQQCSL